jgi:deoxyribonuclease V
MKILQLHSWDLTYAQARQLQTELSGRIEHTPFDPGKNFIAAGLDCAFTSSGFYKPKSEDNLKVIAAIVVMRIPEFEVIETASAVADVTFPYIPGLLTFREAPACIEAAKKIKSEPDLFIIDGQGIAHPRRIGIAAHLGLVFNRPTIGCAKSRLIGEYTEPPKKKGSFSLLKDGADVIGAVLRTRDSVKPVYISVGNKITLEDSIRLTLACTLRYRLPEPSRLSHQLVTELRKKISK